MDALREAWRLLRPDGVLLDVRPTADLTLLAFDWHAGQRFLGPIADPDRAPRQAAVDEASSWMAREGFFAPAQSERFTVHAYYDTLSDLQQHIATCWTTACPSPRQWDRARMLCAAHPEGMLVVRIREQANLLVRCERQYE